MLHHYKKLLFCFVALFTLTLSAQDYKSLIENYLQTNGLSHGLNPNLVDFEVNSATTLGNGTSKVVYISQSYNGIKVAEYQTGRDQVESGAPLALAAAAVAR